MNEKERFQLLIKHYGTQEKLGAVLGLPQSSIANWVQRGALSANAIRLIGEKCPEINLRWLITGEGEMLEPEQVTATPLLLMPAEELCQIDFRVTTRMHDLAAEMVFF